jgi:tetratricopeptide (TPR) repeat protein
MIIRFIKMAATFVLLQNFLSACQPSEVTSARLYLKHNNINKATEQLEIAERHYPNNAEVFFLLGATYGRLHRYGEMNEAFDRSLNISDRHLVDIISIREFYWTRYFDMVLKHLMKRTTIGPLRIWPPQY